MEFACMRVILWPGRGSRQTGGADGYILAIMSVPVLSATGIYNPEVMKNGRCIAEPGSVHALFCAGQEETAPKYRTKKKYARR